MQQNAPIEQSASDQERKNKAAQSQTTLVYLLFALHVLFGITALIGVIVCHTKKSVTQGTVYQSHRIWQIWTFWTAAIGYSAGIYYWHTIQSPNIFILTFLWVYYRIAKGWWKNKQQKPVAIRMHE